MVLCFKSKALIEFIGDSITDCGRQDPSFQPLGYGYVRQIHNLLQAGYPELQLRVLNKGTSGNRITSLQERWESDVLKVNPDWLFIYIGTNDVWRFFEGNPQEAVALSEFDRIYRQLLEETLRKTRAQTRLISPYLAETNLNDPFREKLSLYQAVIDQLGLDLHLPVIHLQPAFDWAMLSKPASYWTVDRVHPTPEGHMLIALTILRTAGFRL
jgi:lysophospholipase L1-like esterase